MIPSALYGRVSTEDQAQAFGLTSQVRELRDLARRKGYEVVAELSDDGVSGATLDRPALERLREGVRAGAYAVILVHAPDRLARSLALQLVLLDEFKKAGARVEFFTTPVEDTAEGRLLLNVSGVIGEFEREKIRERTMRGKREKARQGKYVQPSSCPFGYRLDPARPDALIVHEPEAEVVRLIHRLCIDEHKSVRGIAMELCRLGIRAARSRWTPPQVRRVLTEGYAGTRHFNRKQMQPDGRARLRGPEDWIAIPVPAIVTPERQQAARAQLARNKLALVGRPPKQFYLLRGLLVCAICHRRYRGSGTSTRRTYRHQNGERALACAAANMNLVAATTEESVRATIVAALSDPAVLRRGVEAYELRRGATDVELRSRVAHLQKQIEKIRGDERRLIGLGVADREQQSMIEAKLRELAQSRGGLATQLREAEAKAVQHGASADPATLDRLCAQATRGLDKLTPEGWQALLREVVDEVRVLPDRRVEIHGLLPDLGPSPAPNKLEHSPRPASSASPRRWRKKSPPRAFSCTPWPPPSSTPNCCSR